MKHIALCPSLPACSAICLGTANYGTGLDRDTSFALLDGYVAGGGNFLDTAHCYGAWAPGGEGASEKTIGQWLASTGVDRASLVLATKGAHPDLQTGRATLNPADIATHLSQSLERLGTDYVDLYWIHKDDESVPVGEVLDALAEHRAAGRIRAMGCSNWSIARQQAASDYAARAGREDFCASQIAYSLAQRSDAVSPHAKWGTGRAMDEPTWDFHRRTGRPVAAYESQARGFFRESRKEQTERKFGQDTNLARREIATQLAAELGASPTQVAVAYLLAQPFAVAAIVGPKDAEQLADSLGAGELTLTGEHLTRLQGAGR